MPEFQGSEATCEFMKRMDCAFDFLNSRNPFAKGTKQPITHSYFSQWSSECDKLVTYIFNLKTERGTYLQSDRRQTAIWGFVFNLYSIKAMVWNLLNHNFHPYQYVLTYKFSQHHIELLFNKIRCHGGWNNNPNVLQFKYALRIIIMRNSIETSKTGNCTNFDEAVCES